MSESEIGFLKGLIIVSIIIIILKHVAYFFFIKTMTTVDKEKLDKAMKKGYEIEAKDVASHTSMYASIIYFCGLFLFLNSAIIGAMILRRFL